MGGQGSKDFKAECSNVLIRHEDTVTCCAFSPNEKLLATCSTDRKVIVWDFRKNRDIYVLLQHKAPVTSCCFSANSRILISSGMDKLLAVWDMEKGVLMRKYGAHEAGILFCVYAPGSDFLFATAGEVSVQSEWMNDCCLYVSLQNEWGMPVSGRCNSSGVLLDAFPVHNHL